MRRLSKIAPPLFSAFPLASHRSLWPRSGPVTLYNTFGLRLVLYFGANQHLSFCLLVFFAGWDLVSFFVSHFDGTTYEPPTLAVTLFLAHLPIWTNCTSRTCAYKGLKGQ